jgi:hypothetical protein
MKDPAWRSIINHIARLRAQALPDVLPNVQLISMDMRDRQDFDAWRAFVRHDLRRNASFASPFCEAKADLYYLRVEHNDQIQGYVDPWRSLAGLVERDSTWQEASRGERMPQSQVKHYDLSLRPLRIDEEREWQLTHPVRGHFWQAEAEHQRRIIVPTTGLLVEQSNVYVFG